MRRKIHNWRPSAEQMSLWPAISGNLINGKGEATPRRASPIYWHAPEATPHGPLQRWFYARPQGERMAQARQERQKALEQPLRDVAKERVERTAAEWSTQVKQAARDSGADVVGVTRMRAEWVFDLLQ